LVSAPLQPAASLSTKTARPRQVAAQSKLWAKKTLA
jgi:hypothetical protein